MPHSAQGASIKTDDSKVVWDPFRVSTPGRQDTSLSQEQRAHFSAKRSHSTPRATTRPDDTLQSSTRTLALRSTASTPATKVEEGV